VTKPAGEIYVTYSIPAFTLPPATEYVVLITSYVNSTASPGTVLNTSKLIEIQITKQPLFSTINGGNRLNGYLDELVITGDVFDPNIDGDDATKRAGISITWSCKNILTNSICVDRSNNTIDMTAFNDNYNVTIPAGSLTPYNGYYFKMNASKTDGDVVMETEFQVIIIASDYNVPVLGVSIPNNMVSRRINLDE
jgi:hypothetical protein